MIKQNVKGTFCLMCFLGFSPLSSFPSFSGEEVKSAIENTLTLNQAIRSAQKNDPWLTGNVHKQKSIEFMSVAAGTLPDPKISIGLANLPVNGFNFDQEAMTQEKIGIAQVFPRGNSLAIKSHQMKIKSEALPFQRQDREAKVSVTVGGLWLDAYQSSQSIDLIEKHRFLFEQLADVAEASYSTAVGKTRQQDIVRAQLELTRLEERLDKLAQQKTHFDGRLMQWLSDFSTENEIIDNVLLTYPSIHNFVLSQTLPQVELIHSELVFAKDSIQSKSLVRYFYNHPLVSAVTKKIEATKSSIKLAKQKYKPEWAVSASYGYRTDDALGVNRADLFSVGVTFDLPLFTENKQDKEVQSAISQTESVKTEKLLLLRHLLGTFTSAKGRLLRLKDRQALYKSTLLPQLMDQAEASLTAYTNDDGDFSEVVRSRIAVLNAEIDELSLAVEEQKIHLELNYLFAGSQQNKDNDNG